MLYDEERRDLSITVAGDAMITRRLRDFQEPGFLNLGRRPQVSDVSMANLEMLFPIREHLAMERSATPVRPEKSGRLKMNGHRRQKLRPG